jgi:hypothetical protein
MNAMKALLNVMKSDLLALESMLIFFGVRGWIGFLAGAIGAFILIGIPSELISNPVFNRIVPHEAMTTSYGFLAPYLWD